MYNMLMTERYKKMLRIEHHILYMFFEDKVTYIDKNNKGTMHVAQTNPQSSNNAQIIHVVNVSSKLCTKMFSKLNVWFIKFFFSQNLHIFNRLKLDNGLCFLFYQRFLFDYVLFTERTVTPV